MKGRRNSRFQTHRQIGKQAGCESHHHMSANGSWTEAAERLGSWHRFHEAKRASDAVTQNHQQKTQNPASCSIETNTMSLMFLKASSAAASSLCHTFRCVRAPFHCWNFGGFYEAEAIVACLSCRHLSGTFMGLTMTLLQGRLLNLTRKTSGGA